MCTVYVLCMDIAPSLMFMLYMKGKMHLHTVFAVVHFDSSVMLTNCTCICTYTYVYDYNNE